MEAYLDNSATTKINDDVLALMERVYREDFGNPPQKGHGSGALYKDCEGTDCGNLKV